MSREPIENIELKITGFKHVKRICEYELKSDLLDYEENFIQGHPSADGTVNTKNTLSTAAVKTPDAGTYRNGIARREVSDGTIQNSLKKREYI